MEQDVIEKNLNSNKRLDKDFFELLKNNPIRLEEKQSGKFKIVHDILPKFKEITIVSVRNWLMTGYRQQEAIFDYDRLLHKLMDDEGSLLMSDSPQEMFLQYDAYKNAKGRVLVGGLGLGMFAGMVATKKEVSEVIVVEIEQDVINIAKPRNKKIKVICDDIWKYLENTNEKFDFIYVDIYYHTGAREYIKYVLPMRKIIEQRFPNVPNYFWAEEEMKSQYIPDYDKRLKNG